MKKLFKLSLFIGISVLLITGCGQIIMQCECYSGGVLGGGSAGYGGIEFFIDEYPEGLSLKPIAGDWLYSSDNGNWERINLNSGDSFVLQSNFNDQNQTANGSYRYNDTQLELNINGYHYILDYSLAGGNLILSHEKGTFIFLLQDTKLN